MTSHFDYLADDEGHLFFQKVAEGVAMQVGPTAFEKVASELATNIHSPITVVKAPTERRDETMSNCMSGLSFGVSK